MAASRGRAMARSLARLALALLAAAPVSSATRPAVPPAKTLPPLPPAVHDDDLVIGGREIGARKVSTRMTVKVGVNGTGPYDFVVDSGADTSAIGLHAARTLRLPAGTPVTLHTTTASGPADRVRVDELALGDGVVRDLQLPALRDEFLGADGLIGIDALVEQRLMMDFEKRVITVEDARQPPPRLDGEIVVIARLRRGQLILTQASVNGRPVSAVIDTGSEITIGNLALRDRFIRRNPEKFRTVGITGVSGRSMDLQLARLAELRVGPVILRDVPMAFADVPPFALFGLREQPALLLGTDFLEKFRRVSLDFRARKVRFQLRRCKSTGIAIGTGVALSRLSLADPSGAACRR